jgi:hypothetical protein
LPELERLACGLDTRPAINLRLRDLSSSDPVTARWFLSSAPSNGADLALLGKIGGGYLLRYPGIADFIVDSSGRELRCARLDAGTSSQTLRHLLLDRVLPLVLNLLGHDVLHATAVDTRAGVCAFIGPAGAGKSTLAASFAADGYRIFCDDCLVVRLEDEILCAPGYPGVRLWSDSFSALGNEPVRTGDMPDYSAKFRVVSSHGHFDSKVRPLIAIYRVTRPAAGERQLSTARIERLARRDAFMELVSAACVFDVTEPSTLARHFRFIEQLVAGVAVARLLLPNDFASLPAARRAVLSGIEKAE